MTNVVVLPNIAALRAYSGGTSAPSVWIEGYTNPGDGGEGMFTYVPTDTTNADNSGTIIKDSLGDRYHREQYLGPFNILWFGGYANGSSDNTAALNNALAALPSGGGEIFFPPGKFLFSSAISFTYPSGQFSLSLVGTGADVTKLYWPSTAGITLNLSSAVHSTHFRDMSITTGSAGSYNGVYVGNSTPEAIGAQNDFTRVTFGSDHSVAGYWLAALTVAGLSNVSYDTLFIYGQNAGIGLGIEGDSSISPYYSIVHNLSRCGFFSLGIGLFYATYVQGVAISECNFTNGTTGIYIPSGEIGLTQLSVNNSQFGVGGNQIYIDSPLSALMLTGNLFYVTSDSAGIYIDTSGSINGSTIVGNSFTGYSVSSNTGIYIIGGATESVITGNTFGTLTVGVNLGSGTSNCNVQANVYKGITTSVINSGTSNSVGVATN